MGSRGWSRRRFLAGAGAGLAFPLGFPLGAAAAVRTPAVRSPAREMRAEVVIIGGGLGGCAAAWSALRSGVSVIMTEETAWIGGQCTSQAVPPDENPWIETFGGTAGYQEYRRRVRDYYRRNYPLTAAARARDELNPGNGNVSKLCHEARVSLAVLEEMLAAHVARGRLTVLRRHVPIAAETEGDRLRAVRLRSLESGREMVLEGAYFLDATETGALLPLAGVEHVTGAEARGETGELHAPERAAPENMQAMTWCFAMEHVPGQDFRGDPPRDYGFWRQYVPAMSPPWSGRLLSEETIHPHTLALRHQKFDPGDAGMQGGWWKYRRILDPANFEAGFLAGDGVTLVNWPQNDYLLGNPFACGAREAAGHLAGAKQLSLSLLHWLQTEAPRPDGGEGWPGLRLRGDLTGTEDGLAMAPYIRESRRIRAEFTVVEQHVGRAARCAFLGVKAGEMVAAEEFPDSVGIGYYRIDLHPSTGGDNYIDVESLPFQIPLGALIPRRVENLLPACKNLGVTHITNGCYRLHPVEWNIGEAAGALAGHCAATGLVPRQVRNDAARRASFQRLLESQGVRLAWPEEVRLR